MFVNNKFFNIFKLNINNKKIENIIIYKHIYIYKHNNTY